MVFVGVAFEVEELVVGVGVVVFEFWEVVVDDFPVAVAPGGEIAAAVFAVGVVHEELLWVVGVGLRGEEGLERVAVEEVLFWGGGVGEL